MKPNAQAREVESSGNAVSGTFGISHEDTAHIMGILRDSMYTDRVLAVLREYGANAWDANRESARGGKPIDIHVPTTGEPTLTIRDSGRGLSERDVFEVYTQYGKSTKRGSNVAVGMLGIGSKSAFAYSDQFTVTSWNGGFKRVYVASLDESDLGIMQRLHEEPCDKSETGVEVKVAVKPEDVWEFQRKAISLYSNFKPRPNINIILRPVQEVSATLESGEVYADDGDWVALMGCIPYRVNIEQLRGIEGAEGLWECLHNMSGALHFGIGEVEISASREELKYTKKTKAALLDQFEKLVDEYVTHTLQALKSDTLSQWEKRLRLQGLNKLGLPLPDAARKWAADAVKVFDEKSHPRTFNIIREKSEVYHIGISADMRFLVCDDSRKMAGFYLKPHDYVVRPNAGATLEEVRKELEKVLQKAKLSGCVVGNLSDEPWAEWRVARASSKVPNKKHKVAAFRLTGYSHYGTLSDNWEVVSRAPESDDVYIILDRFQGQGFSNFYAAYDSDNEAAKLLGIPMPEVFGYKTTTRKPVTEADCIGVPYREWVKDYFKNRMTPTLWRYLSFSQWAGLLSDSWGDYNSPFEGKTKWDKAKVTQEHLSELLGENHPIVELFVKHLRGYRAIENASPLLRNGGLDALMARYGGPKTATAIPALKAIQDRYPLLHRYESVEVLWSEDDRWSRQRTGGATFLRAAEWAEYIKTVDTRLEQENAE